MDLKKEAARASMAWIREGSAIGLGAGSTIAHLVLFLKEEIDRGLKTKVYTASLNTRQLLLEAGIPVRDTMTATRLDLYLDSCDQVDQNLNALKSGGGIHTSEKLLAAMASSFVILADRSKYVSRLDTRFPLVVEIIPEALGFVAEKIKQEFPECVPRLRKSDQYDGPVITRYGNYLLDCRFTVWPELGLLHKKCREIAGIVENSLFYQMAQRAVVAGEEGVRIYEREGSR
jgi:ribose 5-phosphate isomerase A